MTENGALTKLLEWLKSSGRTQAWFARQVGYSYQTTWGKLNGREALTDRFVQACFQKIPDLPPNIFEAKGYVFDGEAVLKRISGTGCSAGS